MEQLVETDDFFKGKIVLAAPHMDDCVLACGGTLAILPEKKRIHVIYATDGMASPAPVLPWRDRITTDLSKIRMEEARNAMQELGIPKENVHFLKLPDGNLQKHKDRLYQLIFDKLVKLNPELILIPFRYDRHLDHIAVNHTIMSLCKRGKIKTTLYEYFVYSQWQLLPSGDIRKNIKPEQIFRINIMGVSVQKRKALEQFRSQTTRFFSWQTRPNLTPQLLDQVCQEPECFLKYDPTFQSIAIFKTGAAIIPFIHWLEPILKEKKDRAVAIWRRVRENHRIIGNAQQ